MLLYFFRWSEWCWIEQILDFYSTKVSFRALYFSSVFLLSAVPVACGARQPSGRASNIQRLKSAHHHCFDEAPLRPSTPSRCPLVSSSRNNTTRGLSLTLVESPASKAESVTTASVIWGLKSSMVSFWWSRAGDCVICFKIRWWRSVLFIQIHWLL